MWNAGSKPARMFEVITTAGFEHFFRELSWLTARGAPETGAVGELAQRYQPFVEPPGCRTAIERYGLTAPPCETYVAADQMHSQATVERRRCPPAGASLMDPPASARAFTPADASACHMPTVMPLMSVK